MKEPDFLLFASDATLAALAGGALIAMASVRRVAERRRMRRRHIDAVGFMPWTTVSFLSFFPGVVLLAWPRRAGWPASRATPPQHQRRAPAPRGRHAGPLRETLPR
jgi:hypothetical protein